MQKQIYKLLTDERIEVFTRRLNKLSTLKEDKAKLDAAISQGETGITREIENMWKRIEPIIPWRKNAAGRYVGQTINDFRFLQQALEYQVRGIDITLQEIVGDIRNFYTNLKRENPTIDVKLLAADLQDDILKALVPAPDFPKRDDEIMRIFRMDLPEPKRLKMGQKCSQCGHPANYVCSQCQIDAFCGKNECFKLHIKNLHI